MTYGLRRSLRMGAAVAAATATAALVHGVARSQGPPSVAAISIGGVNRVPRRGTTGVDLGFTVPPGFRLTRRPRVVVRNAQDQQIEVLPIFITHGAPVGKGHRELHSYAYPPGTYRVYAEFTYETAGGVAGTAVSPTTTFTVTR